MVQREGKLRGGPGLWGTLEYLSARQKISLCMLKNGRFEKEFLNHSEIREHSF
jgi:hypothetical protein